MNKSLVRLPGNSHTIYLVYCQTSSKDQFDILQRFKIMDLCKEIQSEGYRLCLAPYSVNNVKKLDKALEQGVSIDLIIKKMHKCSLDSFEEVWFAGPGCSYFAREVMRRAFSLEMFCRDVLDRRSVLKGCFRWYELDLEREQKRKQMQYMF